MVFPGMKYIGSLLHICLICISRKNSQTNERKATLDSGKQPNERKATLDRGKQQSRPVNQFPDLSQFADPEPLE